MRLFVPVILICALTAMPAGAQTNVDAGGTTCAQFLKARTNDALRRQALNWLYGYASGLSAGLSAAKSPAALTFTDDQVVRSATDYCQANPGATLAKAASAWIAQAPPVAETPPPERGFFLDLSKRPAQPGGRQ